MLPAAIARRPSMPRSRGPDDGVAVVGELIVVSLSAPPPHLQPLPPRRTALEGPPAKVDRDDYTFFAHHQSITLELQEVVIADHECCLSAGRSRDPARQLAG